MIGFSQFGLLSENTLSEADLVGLVMGQLIAVQDVLAFDEPGQEVSRSLALPRIAGMDGIEVARASLRLRGQTHQTATEDFTLSHPGGADRGLAVSFPRPQRLQRLRLANLDFPDSVKTNPLNFSLFGKRLGEQEGGVNTALRLVVRLKGPDGYGPPAYAEPPFFLESPLYDPILVGATFTETIDGALVNLPGLPTDGALVQIAHGETPDALLPVDCTATVETVEINALAEGVSAGLDTADGEVLLFEHGPPLAPEAEARDIPFLPLATRVLTDALETGSAATLALPLHFRSASAGRVALLESRLEARYRLDAWRDAPESLPLHGAWVSAPLETAAARVPAETRLALRAQMLGRRLNEGSLRPDAARPAQGVRVVDRLEVAAPLTVIGADAPEPLVALSLCLAADAPAEISATLRADAAGLPGAELVAPAVAQIVPGGPHWVMIDLPDPFVPATGPAPVWVCIRTTYGAVRWFGQPSASSATSADTRTAQVSRDGGGSWSAPGGPLSANFLGVTAIETVADPQPAPQILGQADGIDCAFAPSGWDRVTDREFSFTGTFPSALVTQLSNRPGDGRSVVPLLLFSADLLTLISSEAALFYDPMAAPGQQFAMEGAA